MRFTSMFRYGLRAMAVIAENYGKDPVSAREISEAEDISPSFLEQLLAQLRKKGLLSGIRGPGGGFRLARDPSMICIGDIVEALEGPVIVAKCLGSSSTPGAGKCERFDECKAIPFLRKMESEMGNIFESYTLADLLGDAEYPDGSTTGKVMEKTGGNGP